jgi:peptidylamidoglycolate lyase
MLCCALLCHAVPAGKVLRQWGAGLFYMPHMLTVDRNNTIWVTDVGRHQALQFSASGELLREVGVKLTPGHDTQHLCKPTQVRGGVHETYV